MLATTIHESNTTHPTTKDGATTTHPPRGRNHFRFPHIQGEEVAGLLSQSPIVCLTVNFSPASPQSRPLNPGKRLLCTRTDTHYRAGPSNESLSSPNSHRRGRGISLVVLLRKEVIQPHLPVRLPCYDFVPIADPTFDGSLPYGLGHRLRVLPTFMT